MVAFGILLILPIIYYFYNYSINQSQEISQGQLSSIGNKIINNAEPIYSLGPPSQVSLNMNFPSIINKIYITGKNRELVFNLTNNDGEMVFWSEVPLDGPFINKTGKPCGSTCHTGGSKTIILITYPNNVSIIIK